MPLARRFGLFAEARATLFPGGESPLTGAPVQRATTPVTLGFRF